MYSAGLPSAPNAAATRSLRLARGRGASRWRPLGDDAVVHVVGLAHEVLEEVGVPDQHDGPLRVLELLGVQEMLEAVHAHLQAEKNTGGGAEERKLGGGAKTGKPAWSFTVEVLGTALSHGQGAYTLQSTNVFQK